MKRARIYSEEGEKIHEFVDAFVLAQQLSDIDVNLSSENVGPCTSLRNSFVIRVNSYSNLIHTSNFHYNRYMNRSFSIDVFEENKQITKANIIINLKSDQSQNLKKFLKNIGIATHGLYGERCHIEFSTAEQIKSILLEYMEKRYK